MSIFRRGTKDRVESPAEVAGNGAESADLGPLRTDGPLDVSEVSGLEGRLDLGALWLAPVANLELRLEVDQATDTISGMQFVLGDSAAQVQAFAAPRSGGLWAEIRAELSEAIATGGGTVEEAAGSFGAELHAQMPQRAADGRTVLAPARFVGIDGPRWFVRAVLSGRAATDDEAAAPLFEAVRSLVVVRGSDPMAPRDLLPLKVPDGPAPQAPDDEDGPGQPDLNPFERGPELSEVR